jgi:hypothetical protein
MSDDRQLNFVGVEAQMKQSGCVLSQLALASDRRFLCTFENWIYLHLTCMLSLVTT